MSSLFHSEPMTLAQLFLQSEAAYTCVAELGEIGLVQFRDMNPNVNAFQRKFVNEVRRCNEMERKLRFFEKEIKKETNMKIPDDDSNPPAPQPRELIELEASFEKLDAELRELIENQEALHKNFLELSELKYILEKTQIFFHETGEDYGRQEAATPSDPTALARLGFVAGVINRDRLLSFERMLWRACHGNVFLKQADISEPLTDPATGDPLLKSVFIVFFQGEQLKIRVKKICEGFRATLYPCPEDPAERKEVCDGVKTRINDLNTVLTQTMEHRKRVLSTAAVNLRVWFIKVRKIKSIYHTLNLFTVSQKCLIGECWIPDIDVPRIQEALRRGTEQSGSSVPSILNRMSTKEAPPTFNRTNKFNRGFQTLIDAYGVATYREMNPAPFTVITFPFLFAVMFGDAGHGLIMFLFALTLVWKEKQIIAAKNRSEIYGMIFGGRYIILMMGLFSIYTGLIYNDIFSKSINLFGSQWNLSNQKLKSGKNFIKEIFDKDYDPVTFNPVDTFKDVAPYPFGVDPIWQLAINKLTFLNSFKMKLSIVLGFTQMLFGVLLSFRNQKFFNNKLDMFTNFIPQMIFLNSILGYLTFLIFLKWFEYGGENSKDAPSLLLLLINMYSEPENPMFAGQYVLQLFLLLMALISVPWMLFVKPIILYMRHHHPRAKITVQYTTLSDEPEVKTKKTRGYQLVDSQDGASVEFSGGSNGTDLVDTEKSAVADEEDEFILGEVIIIQAIHTIEFCLNCISHTASYLRLWALSLAHAELSEVLWNMVLNKGFTLTTVFPIGGIILTFVFAFWVVLTCGILILMEGLSAFLHALRLHWVEFQSKFYHGEGYIFMPFTFRPILENPYDD